MNFLLDTHTWIWLLHEPRKLSKAAQHAVANPNNLIHLSPVSVWEASQLYERKRISTNLDFLSWCRRALTAVPLREVPLTLAIAEQASQLQLPQPDFGDLFLAATALVEQLTLITADEQLLAAKWLKTIPAA